MSFVPRSAWMNENETAKMNDGRPGLSRLYLRFRCAILMSRLRSLRDCCLYFRVLSAWHAWHDGSYDERSWPNASSGRPPGRRASEGNVVFSDGVFSDGVFPSSERVRM